MIGRAPFVLEPSHHHSPIGYVLIVVALFFAFADWVAVARRNKRAEYVLKPATLAILFVAASLLKPFPRSTCPSGYGCIDIGPPIDQTWVWIFTLVALGLSLAGDVFLMLPQDLFVAGLGSFLLAHIAYVLAFSQGITPPFELTFVAAIAVAGVALALFLRMRQGMIEKQQREFIVPVAIYVVAIGAMVVSAITTAGKPEWSDLRSWAAIAGAVLFMASDSMIGWKRFVAEFRGADVAIISTYHLGQVLLVLGLLG